MSILQAIILGIVQGLTELLPISSSAHLNLIPLIFNWGEMPESFDLALHIGTLLAITAFFFKDWLDLIKGGYKRVVKKEKTTSGKIFWYIVLATIPAGILSLVLDKVAEFCFAQIEMIIIAIMLIVMGIVLYVVDKKSKSETKYEDITLKQSLLIGMSQAIAAAFPGVSRSGITITVARALKIDREGAAKYSFLLSTPIIAGAILVKITSFQFNIMFIAGVLSSFIVGVVVIRFLLKYLQKGSFKVFAVYRILFGVLALAMMMIK